MTSDAVLVGCSWHGLSIGDYVVITNFDQSVVVAGTLTEIDYNNDRLMIGNSKNISILAFGWTISKLVRVPREDK